MSKTWLKTIKSVNDFFETESSPPYSAPDYLKRDRRALEKGRRQFLEPLQIDPSYRPYFGSRLHDSYVIDTHRSGETLRISLSHDGTEERLVGPLADKLGIELSKENWPINLVFKGVTYARWAVATKTGQLTYWRPTWRPVEDRSYADSLVSDRFTYENGRLQWLAEFWGADRGRNLRSVYLMLDCSDCWVEDLRKTTFLRCFGTEWLPLWNEIEEVFPDLFYYRPEFSAFLEERVVLGR